MNDVMIIGTCQACFEFVLGEYALWLAYNALVHAYYC